MHMLLTTRVWHRVALTTLLGAGMGGVGRGGWGRSGGHDPGGAGGVGAVGEGVGRGLLAIGMSGRWGEEAID